MCVYRRVPLVIFLLIALSGLCVADTSLGAPGHYLAAGTRVFLRNPDGKAFKFTLHRFNWWIGGGWNRPDLKVKVVGPAGKTVLDRVCKVLDEGCTMTVPAGAAGTYRVDVDPRNTLNYWYLTSTLDHSVAWTGKGLGDLRRANWFNVNPFAPRRWYFWVPSGTREFTIVAQNGRGRSHREDHGITVYSPRGQRMAVLWGQANPDDELVKLGDVKVRIQKARVLVEPGTAGRFWSVECRMGDSHTYSDVNLTLVGVPPCLARSPEEWFDAETGKLPDIPVYDESHFVQSDLPQDSPARAGPVKHWSPAPALGDPDACEIRTPARIALWNPEGRRLRFVIGTYLPRNMFPLDPALKTPRGALKEEAHDHARVRVAGGDGKIILDGRTPLLHLHGGERWVRNLETGKGVSVIEVTEAEHFWMYTYPATPLVMVGRETGDGWHRFFFEAGTARDWFFRVPVGVGRFSLRASAADKTDVMRLEVASPDRVCGMIYANRGSLDVDVPPGMDGKIWHVRIDIGGATRFDTRGPRPRFPSMNISLDLKGVPGYLAPTWEQWFDPEAPGRRRR